MDALENMLLDQTARHEVLATLIETELSGLKAIKQCLDAIRTRYEAVGRKMSTEKDRVQKLREAERSRIEAVQVPAEDVVVRTLFKVLADSGE